MINLTKLPADEAERLAYVEGFTGTAALFARIAKLEHAIEAMLDVLSVYEDTFNSELQDAIGELREVLP